MGAAIAQWIRLCLPICSPRFESQAHHQCFLLYRQMLYFCNLTLYWEKDETGRIWPILKIHVYGKIATYGCVLAQSQRVGRKVSRKHSRYRTARSKIKKNFWLPINVLSRISWPKEIKVYVLEKCCHNLILTKSNSDTVIGKHHLR